jgi:Ribbon-helix-helix protein, copG family
MRTTVTLDEDVAAKLQEVARERGLSFKVALNGAIRAGLAANAPASRSFRVRSQPMGIRPGVNLDKALSLAYETEDAEIARKLELRK